MSARCRYRSTRCTTVRTDTTALVDRHRGELIQIALVVTGSLDVAREVLDEVARTRRTATSDELTIAVIRVSHQLVDERDGRTTS